MRLKVSGESEPLKKAIGVAKWQSRCQKISNFSARKSQGNQHMIIIIIIIIIQKGHDKK